MLHVFAALLAGVALAVVAPNEVPDNHLKLDFSVVRGSSFSSEVEPNGASVSKRGGSSELMLMNKQLYYLTTLKIGSQGDEVEVSIDTGSSDLLVMANNVTCYPSPAVIHKPKKRDSVFSQHQSLDFGSPGQPGPIPNMNEEQMRRNDILSRSATVIQKNNGIDSKGNNCTSFGVFEVEKSNSFIYNHTAPRFSIVYGDTSFAHGTWGTDYIGVGALNVSGCSFVVVKNTSVEQGVLGIGLAGLETTNQDSSDSDSDSDSEDAVDEYEYENFPLRLKSTGVINKVLYSLYLNSSDVSSGSLLFGAVDHGKYNGQLQTVPIINFYVGIQTAPIYFHIVLDSVTLESASRNISVSSSKVAALLDSGQSLSWLPHAIFDSFVASLGGVLSDDAFSKANGVKRVDCSYNTTSVHAMFNFSGAEIRVPLSDLIYTEGSQCYLALLKQPDDPYNGMPSAILGDNFLRSAYVVFDIEDYQISLAQARYSNSEDIEVVFSSVPSAVSATGYSSTSLATSIMINSNSHTAVLSWSDIITSNMTTIDSISTSSEFISSQSRTNVSSAAFSGSDHSGSKTSDASSASSSSTTTGSKKSSASKSVYLATSMFFGIMGSFAILSL